MTKEEYESLITDDFVSALFEGSLLNGTSNKWVITICGKLVTIDGRIFFDSKEQANKAFYNSFSWRSRNRLYRIITGDPYGWWRSNNPDRRIMWEAIKSAFKNKYDFKIMQV